MPKKKNNKIGIDQESSKILAQKLNELLANYQIFYMNVHGFHWNIQGDKFFELHPKFEELYTDLLLKIDEIAERILTTGHTPLHTWTVESVSSPSSSETATATATVASAASPSGGAMPAAS